MIRNRYVKRRVAETDKRACFLCYRPTTVVLVNEVPSADFFYACESHLDDPGFATPDKELVRQQEERQKQIEELKLQWQEVQSKRKPKEAAEGESKNDTKAEEPASLPTPSPDLKPVRMTYELNKGVYNLRIGSKKRAAQEKKVKSMLDTPGLFPEVPKHKPT